VPGLPRHVGYGNGDRRATFIGQLTPNNAGTHDDHEAGRCKFSHTLRSRSFGLTCIAADPLLSSIARRYEQTAGDWYLYCQSLCGTKTNKWSSCLFVGAVYAKERKQFGQSIASFQAVQFKLVDMLATLEQARLFTYHAARLADLRLPITIDAALAKIIAADGCNEICRKAVNIFGGYGLTVEFPIERHSRDSFFPMIGGGTSDIMRLIVGRNIGL